MKIIHTVSVSVLAIAFLVTAVPADAQESENGGLTDTQINSVLDLLQSFEVDADTVATVEAVLKGEEVEEKEEDDGSSAGGQGQGRPEGAGPPGGMPTLPEQASDRAHQVMQCLELGRVLRHGASGDEVAQLQGFLKEMGHFDFPEITGYFGSVTEGAVQSFQSTEGIVSDGSPNETGFGQVGPRTRAAIAQATCLRETAPGQQEDAEGVEEDEDAVEDEDENGDEDEEDEEENDEEEEDEDEDEEENDEE